MQRAAVQIGAVLGYPILHLGDGHALEDAFIGVHFLLPGAGIHLISVALVALGGPVGQVIYKGFGRFFDYTVHLAVRIVIVIIGAAWPTGDVVVVCCVVVGGDDLKDVHFQIHNALLCIGDHIGNHFVKGIDGHALIILAGAQARGGGQAQTMAQPRGGNSLGGRLSGFFLNAHGLFDGGKGALAGPGSAGHNVHAFQRTTGKDALGQLFQRNAAQRGGFLIAGQLQGYNFVAVQGDFSLDGAAIAVSFASERLSQGKGCGA